MKKIRVAGYAKLAKQWDNRRESVLQYYEKYYRQMFEASDMFEYVGLYIDITGNKDIYKRKEMVRLIKDCREYKVDCIVAMTKGYLAANMRDFSYLFKYLMDVRHGEIEFMTEDENDKEDTSGFYIDTVKNEDDQKGALREMVEQLVGLYPNEYDRWRERLEEAIGKLAGEGEGNG